jgi:hypothetical protein
MPWADDRVPWARAVGVSYRQLDYWTRRGWLRPEREQHGTGYARLWPEVEQRIVRIMARLLAAGFTPEGAARTAREAVELSIPGGEVVIVQVTDDLSVVVRTG